MLYFSIINCAWQNDTNDFFNNFLARFKIAFLPKRPQFAENIRLLGKGVNMRDFYNHLQKAKPRFCLLPPTPRGRRDG